MNKSSFSRFSGSDRYTPSASSLYAKAKVQNHQLVHLQQALRQRGSLTVWLDESALSAWTDNSVPERRGRPLHYIDMAITTVLMVKRVFNLSLRALQGFVDSIFTLMKLPLCCHDCTLVSRRAKTVNINIKTPTRGEIAHLVIDGTGLKVFGEGEWKVKQHGAEYRWMWRKLHLAVDSATHEVICADLPLSGTTDAQALAGLICQTYRKIRKASADGAYDTRNSTYEHPSFSGGLPGHSFPREMTHKLARLWLW